MTTITSSRSIGQTAAGVRLPNRITPGCVSARRSIEHYGSWPLSYFEHYYNLKGEKTLRAYSRPVNLARFDRIQWMTSDEPLWAIPEYLCEISHTAIFEPTRRMYMDERLFKAGLVGRARNKTAESATKFTNGQGGVPR